VITQENLAEDELDSIPREFKAGPIRVLCVDDNRDLANTIAMLLDFGGFDARICYDGFDAVEEAIHFRPEVCLIDIQMPGRSGLEVARQIHRHFGDDPPYLIAVTAMGDAEHQQQVRDAGFHQHLVKPVEPDQLLAEINANWKKPNFKRPMTLFREGAPFEQY
jgi:two-component system OmpR family response regulator